MSIREGNGSITDLLCLLFIAVSVLIARECCCIEGRDVRSNQKVGRGEKHMHSGPPSQTKRDSSVTNIRNRHLLLLERRLKRQVCRKSMAYFCIHSDQIIQCVIFHFTENAIAMASRSFSSGKSFSITIHFFVHFWIQGKYHLIYMLRNG